MQRRDFLLSGAGLMLGAMPLAAAGSSATVLYDEHATVIASGPADSKQSGDNLWVRKSDLTRINGFELKPQGACRADVCIPIKKDMTRGGYFDLTSFARLVGQAVVTDASAGVWSFGEIPAMRGSFLASRVAPDFAVPDRKGRVVHLSGFRGKKVLVVTWASW
jgi:hypothetical protein